MKIKFKTAKLAKEKKFNIPVTNYINVLNQYGECLKLTTYYNDGGGVNDAGGQEKLDYNTLTDIENDLQTWSRHYDDNNVFEFYSAPTQSELQTWLRNKHNIEVYVVPYSKNNHKIIGGKGYYEVVIDKLNITFSGYKIYEEALEVGLVEALKLIKL